MVYRQTKQQKTLNPGFTGFWLFVTLLLVLVAALSATTCFLVFAPEDDARQQAESSLPEEEPKEEPEEETVALKTEDVITPIDFQPVVDEWSQSRLGDRSVIIYDLELDKVVGAYNTTEKYNTASLYKLFVVYEGYRRVQTGAWSLDDETGATGRSVRECLDSAIRESDSACAESLLNMIGRDEMNGIILNDYGAANTDIESLVSTPEDISKMMRIFYKHDDVRKVALISQMKDSFLNQPATVYDWRQGLPSGFQRANVYNKVGWDYNADAGVWNVYHDAAIVEFPEAERHFVVVVMSNYVPFREISELGAKIEESFYNQYVLKN